MKSTIAFILLAFISCCILSCKEEPIVPDNNTGKIGLQFEHLFNNEPLIFDSVYYINAAGNEMLFSEIQYFISDVTLHYSDGSNYMIHAWKDIHYVDSDIPTSMHWTVYDSIPAGTCDSVSFTFGINEEKNKSFLFVNPPESLMFWPDILGGGFHYLKLNGKWISGTGQLNPFNFHLGIGQQYDNEGNVTGFIQNYFTVVPGKSSFEIRKNSGTTLVIKMNTESWFNTPNLWDFNHWGGDIMQNQAAMHAACENGNDVFSLDVVYWDD